MNEIIKRSNLSPEKGINYVSTKSMYAKLKKKNNKIELVGNFRSEYVPSPSKLVGDIQIKIKKPDNTETKYFKTEKEGRVFFETSMSKLVKQGYTIIEYSDLSKMALSKYTKTFEE